MCNPRATSTPGPSPLQSPEGDQCLYGYSSSPRCVKYLCLMRELWSKASHRHISDCHSTASKLTDSATSASDRAGQRAVSQHQHSHFSLAHSADHWSHSLGCTQLITFPYPICLHTSSHPYLVQVFSGSLTSYHLHRILTLIFPCCLTKLMECSLPGSKTRPLVEDLSRSVNWGFWNTCWKVP